MCSSGWLHFFQNKKNGNKDWTAALYSWSYWLQIYSRESEAQAQGPAKVLVLSLQQSHAHYYRLYEKGTTRAILGLQGLHLSNAFWHPNMFQQVWVWSYSALGVLNSGGNTKTIVTHLREVHYRLATVMWCLSIICQYVSAGGLRVLIKVQDKVTQEV